MIAEFLNDSVGEQRVIGGLEVYTVGHTLYHSALIRCMVGRRIEVSDYLVSGARF